MADEKQNDQALIPVEGTRNEFLIVKGKTPEELIKGLMVTMSQSEKDWRDFFAPGSDGMTDLATGVRLADVLQLPQREVFMSRLRQMEKIYDKKDNRFSFNVAATMVLNVFDLEDSQRWRLSQMSQELRRWCVEVIKKRLGDIVGDLTSEDVSDLIKVQDIVTRSNAELTAWGYAMTYLTEDEAEELDEEVTDEQRKIIEREQSKRLKMVAEALERRKREEKK